MGTTSDIPEEQQSIRDKRIAQLAPYQFKKGQSGNPSGRPLGKSLKERAKIMLASMDDDEIQEYLEGIDKKTIWAMAEGNPDNKTDLTTKGEKINALDPKILEATKKYEEEIKATLNVIIEPS